MHLKVKTTDGELDAVAFPDMIGPLEAGTPGGREHDGDQRSDSGPAEPRSCSGTWTRPDPKTPARATSSSFATRRGRRTSCRWKAQESPTTTNSGSSTRSRGCRSLRVVSTRRSPAVAAGIKSAAPEARVGYLMTDAGPRCRLRGAGSSTQLQEDGPRRCHRNERARVRRRPRGRQRLQRARRAQSRGQGAT